MSGTVPLTAAHEAPCQPKATPPRPGSAGGRSGGRPGIDISAHMATIREAVAEWQDRNGLLQQAARTRSGELDQGPMVQAAAHAVRRVLVGMFE